MGGAFSAPRRSIDQYHAPQTVTDFLSTFPTDPPASGIADEAQRAAVERAHAHMAANNPEWLDTGDVILFQGSGRYARLIQFFTWSRYSHAGVLHRKYVDDNVLRESTVHLFECTNHRDGLQCSLQHSGNGCTHQEWAACDECAGQQLLSQQKKAGGVRLVPLTYLLNRYLDEAECKGLHSVHVCVIKTELDVAPGGEPYPRLAMGIEMATIERTICSLPYDTSTVNFLESATHLGRQDVTTLNEFTCMGLVARVLVELGIVRHEYAGRLIAPKSLTNGSLPAESAGATRHLSTIRAHYEITRG
jgi:hypothetical protein